MGDASRAGGGRSRRTAKADKFNGDMLQLARGARGLTQTGLATALSVSQSKLSKWEDGLSVPTTSEVERAANELGFPVVFFQQPDRIQGFATCCIYHRKQKSLPVRSLNQIHDRINVLRMGVDRLARKASIESVLEIPQFDIDDFDGDAAEVANLTRAAWKMPRGPVKNLVEWVEAAGGIIVPMSMGTDKIAAVSLWPAGMHPMFFVNDAVPADRWRFSLAHELGHLVMHRIATPNAEQEADQFASEFLMPSREIAAELRGLSLPMAARLKHRWRVSMQALILKARDTGSITPRKCKSLYARMSQLGYRKREPEPIEQETPTTLASLVELHTNTLGYSMQEVAEVALCLDEQQFRRRYLGDTRSLRLHDG